MNLIGIKVKHKVFGIGEITEQLENCITVKFENRVSKFVYPDAFYTFIKASDEKIHSSIIADIEEAKAVVVSQRNEETILKSADEQRRVTQKATISKAYKNIDEMFSEDYHAENLARQPILTYQQVENQFGIKISGFGRGINPTNTTVVLISSIGKASGKFVYHDKWTTDGDYLYSGEGRTGNQTMTKGNLAIKNAFRDGKQIHLFVKFSPQEYYYQGVFELVNYIYEDEKGENGNIRKEYKFRLKKVINV